MCQSVTKQLDQLTELRGVPLKKPHGKLKRSVVSVADPTDILTNLQLAHIPMEESSELTRGLGIEEVHRLNQKPERIRSPADRLKLFSFSKRHLKLPFSRGKGKKEKHVKLSLTPEKTSPKRKGSKHETRNKRLSRAQAGEYFTRQVVYIHVYIYLYVFGYMYVCSNFLCRTLYILFLTTK